MRGDCEGCHSRWVSFQSLETGNLYCSECISVLASHLLDRSEPPDSDTPDWLLREWVGPKSVEVVDG